MAARGFHRIIIKEDKDLRGREPGEVASLLCRIIGEEAPERECQTILDECEALRTQLRKMQEGEVVGLFYDKLEPVLEVLREAGAKAASAVELVKPQPFAPPPQQQVAALALPQTGAAKA